ncbi:MAG: hypothetical protein K9L70_05240 [Thiohalocapsa sp.]|jgi:hypothetical protein|nr:hypothetical protein [Thiohalocapsa sp.]MCF7988893.1 hypothetical protein [Thiohalocapsa sp.]
MRNKTLFELVFLVAISYTLLEMLLRQFFDTLPRPFDFGGVTLALASTPWSLLALRFFHAVESPLGRVVRDFAFVLVIAGGVALNAVLLKSGLAWIIARLRED